MNAMIRELSERLRAPEVRLPRHRRPPSAPPTPPGVARGGERRRAARSSPISAATPPSPRRSTRGGGRDAERLSRRADQIIQRHGGDVDKFIGDEVVAVFRGAAMERDAVACGLEIQQALAGLLEAHPEWNLHVGLGIAAGEVVMGAIGARDRLDFTVLGGIVNLASRLCDAAPADAILVSAPVRDALAARPSSPSPPCPPSR